MVDGAGELYVHDRTAFTVGALRNALAGLPDHLQVLVYAPARPGGPLELEQIIVDTGHGWVADEHGEEHIDDAIGLVCDFPSGEHVV